MRIVKIHIVGGPGSGKSYMARRISSETGVPHFDLDNIVWDNKPTTYGVKASIESRNENLMRILANESWIIGGTYYKWLRDSFIQADKIFVLTPNVYYRHWRIIKRFVKRKLGIEKSAYRETWDGFTKMLKWNHQFDANNLNGTLNILAELSEKVVVCKKNTDIMKWIALNIPGCETRSNGI